MEADELLRQLIAKGEEFELMLAQSEDEQSALMKEIAAKEKEHIEQAQHDAHARGSAPMANCCK